ncbi:MAG: histidine phosphatase family protein [Candidatus Amulumruptor caecigallinarius]|nr:histidine phosphatase family protein [Candidatus Amulumruptor caecigallinarius]
MAQDLNKTGGIYYAYPSTTADNTPAPVGFKPFHVSHYGRHGSRYLISDNDYLRVSRLLHKADSANALTAKGKELMTRLDTLMTETRGRGGDLSPLGRKQHHDIASRIMINYPEVFAANSQITARSTLVPRCILSMASFCESLKEKNPRLSIDMESSNRYMPYLCHSEKESDLFNSDKGWWKEVLRKFKDKKTNPDRLVSTVFSDLVFVERYVNPYDFMWGIYWLASDAQNTEGKISFHDYFTAEELFDLWQCFNATFYGQHANYIPAEGKHLKNAENLLNNIIDTANQAIASDTPSAALRFGHDGNIIPLAALMHLENCYGEDDDINNFYKTWCDWKVSPMAANIQLIFFRNPKEPGKILVKFLHNEKETRIPVETDMWPYYDWNSVKEYFQSVMK